MSQYLIASFYKFINLPDFIELKDRMLAAMDTNEILGTLIIAEEGINGSIAGTPENLKIFYQWLCDDLRFADLWFKETTADFIPFAKAKVKLRKEIVTLGIENINPDASGEYVMPEAWNNLISNPEVLLIDTRNDYEINLGTFKNSINPHTANFRDFPAYVESNLMDKKDQPIAMCCTGGIRCEKAAAYLKDLGFSQVYQLYGGILNYLASIPEEDSLWQGTCFVFDDRIAIDPES